MTLGWAHLEVLLSLIALSAAFMALVVAVSEWWLTVPPAVEAQPEPGALSFETPWLSMLPEFGGGPGRGRLIRIERIRNIATPGPVPDYGNTDRGLSPRWQSLLLDAPFEPPTSACYRCGRLFAVAELYTGKKSGRQACERCLGVMVEAGLATKPAEF